MKTLILTNCTSRKKALAPPIRLAETANATLETLIERWRLAIGAATQRKPAVEVYQGRSITEAKKVTDLVSGDLYVVSAGLGLVNSQTEIPNYDLSLSENNSDFAECLRNLGADPTEWWRRISRSLPESKNLDDLLCSTSYTQIFIALPPSYLDLVFQTLENHSASIRSKVRIFTSNIGKRRVPLTLSNCVMPYDDRLESLPDYAGTKSDFPQRAMRHFVQCTSADQLSLTLGAKAVRDCLLKLDFKQIRIGKKLPDHEIIKIIQEDWVQFNGRSNEILRNLRGTRQIACEQSRFRGLWATVKTQFMGGQFEEKNS